MNFPNTRAIPTGSGGWRVDGYPVSGLVTAEFGSVDEAHSLPHAGVDIGASYGTPVCNPFGKPALVRDVFIDAIRGTGWDSFKDIFGNAVILELDGYISLFAHLRDSPPVFEGQLLAPGAVLGHVGSTGQSTGPHLHWGLAPSLFNGQPSYLPRQDCLNPLAYSSNAEIQPLPGGEFLPEPEQLYPPFVFFSDPLVGRWAQGVEERLNR